MSHPSTSKSAPEEVSGPPFFKEWSSFYWLILGLHAVIIFLFWVFTRFWA